MSAQNIEVNVDVDEEGRGTGRAIRRCSEDDVTIAGLHSINRKETLGKFRVVVSIHEAEVHKGALGLHYLKRSSRKKIYLPSRIEKLVQQLLDCKRGWTLFGR